MGGAPLTEQEQILSYWLEDVGPQGWYRGDKALDDDIRDKFEDIWEDAMSGGCGLWLTDPKGVLAYIILTDQFSRNMFRDDAKAFASDKNARAAAKMAIERDWDLAIPEPERQFFYMPLMHSENLVDQDRAVQLIHTRLKDTGDSTLDHARVHRMIIRQFGRFPFRNKALSRGTTAPEKTFLDEGGYGAAYRNRDSVSG